MKKIYISGPMAGLPDLNYPAFHDVANHLKQQGYEPLNPADIGVREGWEWSDYMRYAIRMLTEADRIYMLEGWWNSKGARAEKQLAEQLGIKRLFIDI